MEPIINAMQQFLRIFFVMFFCTVAVQAQVKKQPVSLGKPAKKVVKPASSPGTSTVSAEEAFTRVKISTSFGNMVVKLYNKTPQHRDNFIKLVKEKFFDSLLFHRVIREFMIQGGDPGSKYAPAGQMLGTGDVGYTIPAEFDSTLIHKRGALCAARTENPAKASSGCQFYIVQGRKSSDMELEMIQRRNRIQYSSSQLMTYKMSGGTPFLDMNYTVFGEVESGMEVIDQIAGQATDGNNRPVSDVRMMMELLNNNELKN
jgi:peptidyl-prolyl cis-trans isomerase B (cyclophilin B)